MDAKVDGKIIKLGGIEYVLPPLPLIKMSKVSLLMQGGDIMREGDYVNNLIDALLWSLQRNYKDLEKEIVSENLDMSNFKTIMDIFMEVNGFKTPEVQSGEVVAK